jgi:hypothetical protein
MAWTYSYTPGAVTNLDRLRFLIGDNRGVAAAYTQATWLTTAAALFTDEELNDLLLSTMCNNDLMSAARICMQARLNRESMAAGVAGTTDTTDRPSALVSSIRQLERLSYPLSATLPQSTVRSNADIDDAAESDMGDA